VRPSSALLALLLSGCLPAPAPEGAPRADVPYAAAPVEGVEPGERAAPALVRTGNVWSDCYRRFQPGDDPSADVARLGEECAAPAGMRPITPVHTGEQSDRDAAERLSFRARRGRCYRAFAVGAPGVRDLDVAVYDASGALVTGDVSRDRWPVVPPRGPLCATDDALYTLAIGVTRGGGAFALQIWGTGGGAP
jgi:hypothetical protein